MKRMLYYVDLFCGAGGTSTGEMLVLKWNGMYWIDAYLNVRTQVTMQANVTHFYIFELFYDEKD